MSRLCRGCKEEKELDCFWKNRNMSDGLHLLCKVCAPLYNKKYKVKHYIKNKEKLLKEKHEWYLENKESKKKYDSQYRKDFPSKKPEACRQWRLKNPELQILFNARRSARIRNIKCSLVLEDIKIPSRCPICNVELTIQTKRMDSVSIDRVNNELEYTKENIAIICWGCNKLKSNATLNILKAMVRYIEERT